ncbi:RNA-directed DNA polymerase from mobile element jockey-like protein [Turdus rufiventris]|nr:RNA-directed DNA polymerase from mobile element jockey-like protein [Turdus rufiventris]
MMEVTRFGDKSTCGGVPLDLLFTNRDGLLGNVVVRGSLEHSDHDMIVFNIGEGNWHPELVDRDGEQNSHPVIQEEAVSNLLSHLRHFPGSLRRSQIIRLTNVMPIQKKGQKEDMGDYRPVTLTSVSGKVMEQIILNLIKWHIDDNQGIRPSQDGFRKGRSCLTNLISFYDQVKHLVDEKKVEDVDFSKVFDTVSHGILLEKLAAHGLDRYTSLG